MARLNAQQRETAVGPQRVVIEGERLIRDARREWVQTNGLGGFAMGTVSGIPERRYHGWLVGATRPPVGRFMALHSCVEWLVVPGGDGRDQRFDLATLRFEDGTESPRGVARLARFAAGDHGYEWTYRIDEIGVVVRRSLAVGRMLNSVHIEYSVSGSLDNARGARLEVRPFFAMRDFHSLGPRDAEHAPEWTENSGVLVVGGCCVMSAGTPGRGVRRECRFERDSHWWRRVLYTRDRERGQGSVEDVYSPGLFVFTGDVSAVTLNCVLRGVGDEAKGGGAPAYVIRPPDPRDQEVVQRAADATETERRALEALTNAADQFIVAREKSSLPRRPDADPNPFLVSTIAGYPWFSDWGRDTMISLPGLLLCRGRTAEALDVLRAFGALRRHGLIPNCFDDGSGEAQYNTVDASLWYIHAACAYLREGGDRAGAADVIRACMDIVESYQRGTDFGIRVDPSDGLVAAGDETSQLTWMDAKRDGVVFTPRHGKAVEINALWYSSLLELALAIEGEEPRRAAELRRSAEAAAASFERLFWNQREACLFDVLLPASGSWAPMADVRPNQIFAASVPHSPLSPEKRRAIVACVRDRLLTPLGLRTLDPRDPRFRGRYEGSLFERDAAYHNGTVWPWLIGPYCEAVMRVDGFARASRDEARRVLAPLLSEIIGEGPSAALGLAPVGQLAEVYDGEGTPYRPRRPEGCMAQAWSVAEVLRVLLLALRP